MKKYESVFILEIRKVDDEGKAFSDEIGKILEGVGGKLLEAVPMGRRQFAREIDGRKAGIYWNYIFDLSPDKVKEFQDKFRHDERVVRLLIVNYERPETKAAAVETNN